MADIETCLSTGTGCFWGRGASLCEWKRPGEPTPGLWKESPAQMALTLQPTLFPVANAEKRERAKGKVRSYEINQSLMYPPEINGRDVGAEGSPSAWAPGCCRVLWEPPWLAIVLLHCALREAANFDLV